tara:strand:- start:60 stop:608 length:549 start_codon:yes stop_codon:yes gene_type:complete
MIALIIFLIFVFVALGYGLLAGISDFKGLVIPNSYSAIIAMCFIVNFVLQVLMGNAHELFLPLWSHVGALVVMFAVSAAMFHYKILGAADSKLASAYALWLGFAPLPVFLFVMSLVGALLGVFALVIRKYKPFKIEGADGWLAQVQAGQSKVPYGIAITFGAFYGFYAAGYLDLSVLAENFG